MAIYPDAPTTDWDTAVETTVDPRIVYPFEQWGDTSGYIVERDFVQSQSGYSGPQALGTADGTYTSALLIQETTPSPIGAGLVSFTRRYGTTPSSFTSYLFEGYTFPGYYDSYSTGGGSFRDPYPLLVDITVTNTFTYSATPPSGVSITGQKFSITKDGSFIDYVDSGSSPTISTYSGYVSGSTMIQARSNAIARAYGVGNVWRQQQFKTPAQ